MAEGHDDERTTLTESTGPTGVAPENGLSSGEGSIEANPDPEITGSTDSKSEHGISCGKGSDALNEERSELSELTKDTIEDKTHGLTRKGEDPQTPVPFDPSRGCGWIEPFREGDPEDERSIPTYDLPGWDRGEVKGSGKGDSMPYKPYLHKEGLSFDQQVLRLLQEFEITEYHEAMMKVLDDQGAEEMEDFTELEGDISELLGMKTNVSKKRWRRLQDFMSEQTRVQPAYRR